MEVLAVLSIKWHWSRLWQKFCKLVRAFERRGQSNAASSLFGATRYRHKSARCRRRGWAGLQRNITSVMTSLRAQTGAIRRSGSVVRRGWYIVRPAWPDVCGLRKIDLLGGHPIHGWTEKKDARGRQVTQKCPRHKWDAGLKKMPLETS